MKIKSVLIAALIAVGLASSVIILLAPAGEPGQATAEATDAQSVAERNAGVIESIFGPGPDDVKTVFELNSEEQDEPPHPDNPGNPYTQQPYSDRAMDQFAALRELFPDNRMIPRRMTPEEVKAYEAEEQELAKKFYVERRVQILTGGLNKAEVDEYFAYRTRFTLDKIELFRYALDNMPEDAPPERRARIERLLGENEEKIARVLAQKEAAYKKNDVAFSGQVYLED